MLECVVILEAEREGNARTWKGSPASKDWDRLEAALKRDGYKIKSHRREFIESREVRNAGQPGAASTSSPDIKQPEKY